MGDNIKIGFRIKKAREDKGYTQEDIARELGMNKSTVQRYETGGVEKIKLPVVEAMARFLEVNPAWLLCKTDDPAPAKQPQQLEGVYLRMAKDAQNKQMPKEFIDKMFELYEQFKELNKDDKS